jgi:osmotically-inducible protein OsmY
MADGRYDYYRSADDRDPDRDVYLDNRSGVGAPRGRGLRASFGPDHGGPGRAYGDDDARERHRDQGYSTYGNQAESRSFRPEDNGSNLGQGRYSNDSYGARSYQSGGARPQPETYGAYAGHSRAESRDHHRRDGEGGRGFWDRTGDTVASWLGDDEARRRHEADVRASHRGKGPKGYKRSDERIHEDVNERLTDDLWLDASHIEIAVHDSEITLTGTVHSRDDRRYAERIAESVSGATHVQNNLRVDANAGRDSGSTSAVGNQDDVLARQAAGKH